VASLDGQNTLATRRAEYQRAVDAAADARLELENAVDEAREAAGEDDVLGPPESYSFNDIVAKLSHFQQRATYGAVGELVDWDPRFVRRRVRCREHIDNCFIVSALTHEPTDYPPERIHPALKRYPRVLRTGPELLAWLNEHPLPR
jgi:hypothetical protein